MSPIRQTDPVRQAEPVLSFVPSGIARTIAEYIVAFIPGALLLFAFIIGCEIAVYFIQNELLPLMFVPVICILPIFCGMVSCLTLEKLRKVPPTFKSGILAGAGAGFFGALFSSLILMALSLLNIKPLGASLAEPLYVAVALIVAILIATILAALGGAVAVKFLKES